ncbi:hypothetical protein HDU67_006031 [Dinochytrium kinnereticum]|nr:hypothetical protein HDU67_006031 [Dinochytrium kinnereticum]
MGPIVLGWIFAKFGTDWLAELDDDNASQEFVFRLRVVEHCLYAWVEFGISPFELAIRVHPEKHLSPSPCPNLIPSFTSNREWPARYSDVRQLTRFVGKYVDNTRWGDVEEFKPMYAGYLLTQRLKSVCGIDIEKARNAMPIGGWLYTAEGRDKPSHYQPFTRPLRKRRPDLPPQDFTFPTFTHLSEVFDLWTAKGPGDEVPLGWLDAMFGEAWLRGSLRQLQHFRVMRWMVEVCVYAKEEFGIDTPKLTAYIAKARDINEE